MAELRDRRVLVTGAAGFIGSHLTRRLVAEGADVHALVRTGSKAKISDVTVHEGDITERDSMDRLARAVKPSVVIHLAGFSHVGRSWDEVDACVRSNIDGTLNLLLAFENTYDRFVYTGSSEIYGDIDVPFREEAAVNPVSPYAVSKYAGERFCTMYHRWVGWPIVCARPFNAYGPGQSPDRVIPETITRSLAGAELLLTSGKQTREFNYVEDIADGYVLLAGADGIDGEVFNIGGGQEVSIRDLVTEIEAQLGNPIEPSFGALDHRPNEIWRMYCDSTKIRQRLGWAPKHTLADGLAKTIDWYRRDR